MPKSAQPKWALLPIILHTKILVPSYPTHHSMHGLRLYQEKMALFMQYQRFILSSISNLLKIAFRINLYACMVMFMLVFITISNIFLCLPNLYSVWR